LKLKFYIEIYIHDKDILNKLYRELKTFNNKERNIFLFQISKIEGINLKNKKYNTIKSEQRIILLEKLKERLIDFEKQTVDSVNINGAAEEA